MNDRKLEKISNEFIHLLKLDGYPIGVKLLKGNESFLSGIKKPGSTLALCQLFSLSRYHHEPHVASATELSLCFEGLVTIGFKTIPENTADNSNCIRIQNRNATKTDVSEFPKIKYGKYRYILISPLDSCPINPDIVIFFGNSFQMLVLISGYLHNKGESCLDFKISDSVACGYIIAEPFLKKKPTLTIPCYGMKSLSTINETDLVFSIPFKELEDLLSGIKAMQKENNKESTKFSHQRCDT